VNRSRIASCKGGSKKRAKATSKTRRNNRDRERIERNGYRWERGNYSTSTKKKDHAWAYLSIYLSKEKGRKVKIHSEVSAKDWGVGKSFGAVRIAVGKKGEECKDDGYRSSAYREGGPTHVTRDDQGPQKLIWY